jgi:hypothetical protein
MAYLRNIRSRTRVCIDLNQAEIVVVLTAPSVLADLSDDQLEQIDAAIAAEQERRMES